jgi:hypothetical protein
MCSPGLGRGSARQGWVGENERAVRDQTGHALKEEYEESISQSL